MVLGLSDPKVFSNLCDPRAGWRGLLYISLRGSTPTSGRAGCIAGTVPVYRVVPVVLAQPGQPPALGEPQRSGPDALHSARDTARRTGRPRPHSFRHRWSPRVILPRPKSPSSSGPLPASLSPPRRPSLHVVPRLLALRSLSPPNSPRGTPGSGELLFSPALWERAGRRWRQRRRGSWRGGDGGGGAEAALSGGAGGGESRSARRRPTGGGAHGCERESARERERERGGARGRGALTGLCRAGPCPPQTPPSPERGSRHGRVLGFLRLRRVAAAH